MALDLSPAETRTIVEALRNLMHDRGPSHVATFNTLGELIERFVKEGDGTVVAITPDAPSSDVVDFQTYREWQYGKMSAASKANAHAELETAAFGLCGEAGEFIDHLKKWRFHGDAEYQGHELDHEYLTLELGDIMWYVSCAINALGLTMKGVLQANVDKLNTRYAASATREESENRVEGSVEQTHQPTLAAQPEPALPDAPIGRCQHFIAEGGTGNKRQCVYCQGHTGDCNARLGVMKHG